MTSLTKFDQQEAVIPVVSMMRDTLLITHTTSTSAKDIVGGSSSIDIPLKPYAILIEASEGNAGRVIIKKKFSAKSGAGDTLAPAFASASIDSEGNTLHLGDIILTPAAKVDHMLHETPNRTLTSIVAIAENAGDKVEITIKF